MQPNKSHLQNKDLLALNCRKSVELNQQVPQDLRRKDRSLTAQAIDESRRIAHDPSVASYSTIQSLREALDQ